MTNRKSLGISTHAWGEASVLEVSLELIRRGYRVFKPVVDDGVDLLVLHPTTNLSARLQVKSASRGSRQKTGRANPSGPFYEFALASVRANYSQGVVTTARKFSEQVDFVILHAVEDDHFLIMKAGLLDDKKAVRFNPDPRSKDLDLEEARKDREAGMTFKELGEKYGITAPAIYERLAGKTKQAHNDLSQQIRDSEGSWDLIQEFFSMEEQQLRSGIRITAPEES